jgi:3'(2'), 5'-bisphosphate nucleotidase
VFILMELEALSNVFPDVVDLTRLAGIRVLSIYEPYASGECDESVQLLDKGDGTPLTIADLASHQILVEGLLRLTPRVPIVSEEDPASLQYRTEEGCYWLLDPLDGTKEFISRNGEFTINVALIINSIAVWGAVYAPVLDAMYWGGSALGAYRRIGNKQDVLSVSCKLSQSTCQVVASKSHLNDKTRSFIDRLGMVELVQAGSSLKFCRVAEGAADVYPRLAPTCEWDTAAAQAVLEGAGGSVTDMERRPLRYGKPTLLNSDFVATADRAWLDAI